MQLRSQLLQFRRLIGLLLPAVAIGCSSPGGPTDPTTETPEAQPASIVAASGDDQQAIVGTELSAPLVVRVVDAGSRPIAGASVTFQVTQGSGSVTTASAVTNAEGLAQTRWVLGTVAAAPQEVVARTLNSAGAAISATFRATSTVDAPAVVTRLAGDGQTGPVGSSVHDSLAVRVADRYGNSTPGVEVRWIAIGGGGTIAPATSMTNTEGVAKASWTLGPTPGPQIAAGQVGSLQSVTFSATATSTPSEDPAGLTVTVLDVGQGDGMYIENGRSRVVIDAGQGLGRMATFIAEKGLAGDTIDLMILTHAHFDHHGGLQEFFKSTHGITIRRFYENMDAASGQALAELRDSVQARAARGELEYIDTDDPCGDGRSICTEQLEGGATLHVMKPRPTGSVNDRSVPLKLIGPDSASFTMWISGDAEHPALGYFDTAYSLNPGMNVDVLKGNHHGSCNGVTRRFLELTTPAWTTFGVSSTNAYGHVHEQTKALHRTLGAPWLRTDQNGRIEFTTTGQPGAGFDVTYERGQASMDGQGDATSAQQECASL
jgi:beta-lactamase superfamily II metal-dependent hydrolase